MKQALEKYRKELEAIKEAGTWKGERIITTPQKSRIDTTQAKKVVNMCANNYLGLSNHPALIEAAKASYDQWGFGLSSVRFICGTQSIHKELEEKLAKFLGMDDVILYSSCFDANGGLFETLLGPEDAIISDELNHASIIDGVRLCKAKRYRYKNNDMNDLRAQLEDARSAGCQVKLIATDGVFSMDGYIANLKGICDLADEFDALVMVDDSHAVGFMGDTGRGTPEYCGVQDRVDIITGTFGKALGGASGGYTAARQEIVDLLRQRSRPYLFSNTVAPAICAASIQTIELLTASTELRDRVHENTAYFREKLSALGFDVLEGSHPIVAVMLYDAKTAGEFAARMLEKGVYVVGDGQTGPATVVEAIAGAMKAARAIQDFDVDTFVERNINPDYAAPLAKRGDVCTDRASCGEIRCLGCATVCETCAEVCPNRANVAVRVEGMRQRQIVHVDGMCNECGNCAVFCPYDSAPYKDKFTLYWSREDFDHSENQGFLRLDGYKTLVRFAGEVKEYDVSDPGCGLYDPLRRLICAVYENYSYLLG